MLHSLHIEHYILIDSLDITFPEGLVIITGQTGAGKSILLGALSLLAGARADATQIARGADSCVVEAEFALGPDEALGALLEAADVEQPADGVLLIRRVVARSGRSRSFINDCPVPVGLLQEVAARLVDIHSQHKSLLLTDARFQLSVLDHFAGNGARLDACREAWRGLQDLRSRLAEARAQLERMEADRDYNEAQWRQLDEAKLVPGELAALEEEQKSLANAEQIKESLGRALSLLLPEGETPGVAAALKEAARQLDHTARYLPAAAELQARLDSARIELEDIVSETEVLDARVDLSPERLEAVEDRMSRLYSLLKKHSCATVEELIAVRERYSEMLFDSTALQDRIAALEKEEQAAAATYDAACAALRQARVQAAPRFAAEITDALHFLELDRAVFEVALEAAPAGPAGIDRAAYLFSSTGQAPVDVAKCASGGELSRIMLSLKAMMARFVGMPTLIFDEIDTGVSGSVADKMGRMICEMGRDMQVFSITHLPQVAAKGDAHYVVSKSVTPEGRTVSSIREVKGEERTREIARLLSGETITPAAIANARDLLTSPGRS
ncbi:MAG: DNA repair protein RecN [Bacteroidales bacterium]|nr:DNA repair protein RecN [Bacteroidales bacterium]